MTREIPSDIDPRVFTFEGIDLKRADPELVSEIAAEQTYIVVDDAMFFVPPDFELTEAASKHLSHIVEVNRALDN